MSCLAQKTGHKKGDDQMKSLSIKLGVVLIGFLIFGYAEVWGEDWNLYGSSENYLGYYDTQSITRPSKDIVRVWERFNFTEKGVLDMVRKFGKKYENLSHSIDLSEINCVEKTTRYLSKVSYDNKWGVIYSSSSPQELDFVVPESLVENLYKEVCK